jgi:hypothetical protein
MKVLQAMCCAAAMTVAFAPGASADQYNKMTYLTFSGPVQIPGATLAPGKYMVKLADPDTGREVIQVWNEDGTKLFATLLTIQDQLMEPADEPVVLFDERPAGEPQAVKAFFYPGYRFGHQLVYPQDQAKKIAAANDEPVMAYESDAPAHDDDGAMTGASVGRIDPKGQYAGHDDRESTKPEAVGTTGHPADDDHDDDDHEPREHGTNPR